jgi:hypothetical protein
MAGLPRYDLFRFCAFCVRSVLKSRHVRPVTGNVEASTNFGDYAVFTRTYSGFLLRKSKRLPDGIE